MSSKHTPGPWVVTPHPDTHVDVFGVGEIMDDKEMQYALSHTFCYQNAEANARLIAAAPELLEALVIARDYAAYAQAEPGDLALIDAVISKATGGAQ